MLIYADKGCLHDHLHPRVSDTKRSSNLLQTSPSTCHDPCLWSFPHPVQQNGGVWNPQGIGLGLKLPKPLGSLHSSASAWSSSWLASLPVQRISSWPMYGDPSLISHINPMTNSPLSVKEVWPIYQSGHKTKHHGLTTSKPYHLKTFASSPILHVPQSHIPCLWTCPSICPCL